MKTARQISFEILNRIQKDNSYSNLILDSYLEKAEIPSVEKSFTSALVYGVIERIITLDYELSFYLNQPLKKLKPQVLTILRIGAYQLLYMDKIPISAAINESVKLTKANNAAFASGLVNAVLRKISVNGLHETDNLSVKYSAPSWICEKWIEDYGEETAENLLSQTFGSVEVTLKINTLKINAGKLKCQLAEEGFASVEHDYLKEALIIKSNGAVHKTSAYNNGLFHVQDVASQLCCQALNPKENDIIFDICAAPGGKSFTIAQHMKNSGEIYSMDLYSHRLELINNGAERLGISNIRTIKNDGLLFNEKLPQADRILCDVPCSGLGVIRKKPEIRYKNQSEVDKLPDLQYSILCVSAKYLKSGGVLIYSTCSLNKDENECVVDRFLNEHKDFESFKVLPDIQRYNDDSDYISLMPHIHGCDGFFIAGIRKK